MTNITLRRAEHCQRGTVKKKKGGSCGGLEPPCHFSRGRQAGVRSKGAGGRRLCSELRLGIVSTIISLWGRPMVEIGPKYDIYHLIVN